MSIKSLGTSVKIIETKLRECIQTEERIDFTEDLRALREAISKYGGNPDERPPNDDNLPPLERLKAFGQSRTNMKRNSKNDSRHSH